MPTQYPAQWAAAGYWEDLRRQSFGCHLIQGLAGRAQITRIGQCTFLTSSSVCAIYVRAARFAALRWTAPIVSSARGAKRSATAVGTARRYIGIARRMATGRSARGSRSWRRSWPPRIEDRRPEVHVPHRLAAGTIYGTL